MNLSAGIVFCVVMAVTTWLTAKITAGHYKDMMNQAIKELNVAHREELERHGHLTEAFKQWLELNYQAKKVQKPG